MDARAFRLPRRRRALPALLMLALLAAQPAGAAEDKKNGELKRLQQKVHALEREQSQLAQGKAELDNQIKEQADKLSQVKRGADTARAQKQALDKALAAAEADIAALNAKLAAADKAAGDTAVLLATSNAALRATEAARRDLEQQLAGRTQSLAECGAKNESLHRLGVNALKLYEDKRCFASGAQLELLTRLKQVGAENMVDEYRDKLDQELLKPQPDRLQVQRQQAERAQREQEARVREQAELAAAEQQATERKKAKQQGQFDKLTRKVTSLLENIEW